MVIMSFSGHINSYTKREIRSCLFLIWVRPINYVEIDFHVLDVGSATRIIQNLVGWLTDEGLVVALLCESDVGKSLVKVALGLLVEGVNKLCVGSFASEVAYDVKQDRCDSNQFVSVGFKFLYCKQGARAEVLSWWFFLGWLGCLGLGFGDNCWLLHGGLLLFEDLLAEIFLNVLGLEKDEPEKNEDEKSFHQLFINIKSCLRLWIWGDRFNLF